ncbi:pimeloyl-ACP methyl ester carboxylesterase [Catenulispora sp. EB89]|uniref:alpha/beta hydrolase family protein n=1 Tax=Catenulispora sp. EB89 TaxID=3156257 RepID=UPI003512440A
MRGVRGVRGVRGAAAATAAIALVAASAPGASASAAADCRPSASYDLTFTSAGDTLPATFLPAADRDGAAALIISGSGPTDRNGDDPQYPHLDTNLNFAKALASAGVSSLRYDKLGSGTAGLGGPGHHPGGAGIDFTLFAQEALDAYRTMASQPGVDPHRLVIVGHSEGGLFALLLANELKGTALAPRAVILAAPLSERYLDLLATQLTEAYQKAAASGAITAAAAAHYIQQMRDAFASIRAGHGVPAGLDDPSLKALLSPVNATFLSQADKYDPAQLARSLGDDFPVLVVRGTKDVQVTGAEVARVADALRDDEDAWDVSIPNADHLFKIVKGVPDPAVDYPDANRKFAPEAGAVVRAFVREMVGESACS